MIAVLCLAGTHGPLAWRFYLGAVAGGLGAFLVVVRESSPAAQRRLDGAAGERRTAAALRPLQREGWEVRHDLAGATGNIDHVVIGPPGVFLLDSKNWSGEVIIDGSGTPALRSPDRARPLILDRIPRQLRREAARHHEVLAASLGGAPWVNPVVVLWAEFEQRVVDTGRVAYVHGDEVVDWLRNRRPRHTREEVARLAAALAEVPEFVERADHSVL